MPKPSKKGIERVPFSPHANYALDIELLTAKDLRKRVAENRFRLAHQIDFYMLALITKGTCNHVIDYQPIPCTRRTLLLVQPGQAQQFDANLEWDGWLVIFRSEFLALFSTDQLKNNALAEILQNLSSSLKLDESIFKIFDSTLHLMQKDTTRNEASWPLNSLLRFQLQSLLMRLFVSTQTPVTGKSNGVISARFLQFKKLVEENFKSQHQVSYYAEKIGCNAKSLTRSCLDALDLTAKEFIASRINLEAKRLLTHTSMGITVISDLLGFDESTNFTKFFKRETGLSPTEFRDEHFSKYN